MDYLDLDDFSPNMKSGGGKGSGSNSNSNRSKKKQKESNKSGAAGIYSSKHVRQAQEKKDRAEAARKSAK